MDNWCSGNGHADLQAFQADNSQMSTDAGNSDLVSVEGDSTQLEADAFTAAASLPPLTSQQKLTHGPAMGWMGVASKNAAAGDINAASSDLQTVTGFFNTDQGALSCR
jgi:hypothetical protein